MDKRTFTAQEVLFEEGSRSGAAYVIQAGRVILSKRTRNGFSKEIADIGPGEIIDEVSLITDEPHSVTAVAHDNGAALVLSKAEYLERLERSDKVLAMILKSVVARLRGSYT